MQHPGSRCSLAACPISPCTSTSTLLSRCTPQSPKNRLDLHEAKDGAVYVKGLNTFVVKSVQEIQAILEVGRAHRGKAVLVTSALDWDSTALHAACACQNGLFGATSACCVYHEDRWKGRGLSLASRLARRTGLWGPHS